MKIVYAVHAHAETAVAQCVTQLDATGPARLVVAFCGGKHAPGAVRAAIAAALGACPVVGGAAAGAISRDGYGYSGFELILAVFYDGDPIPAFSTTDRLKGDERRAGRELGERLRNRVSDANVVALFYDSVAASGGGPPVLHPAAPLVEGFYEGLARTDIHLVGAGLLTDLTLSGGWVFDGEGVIEHGAAALVFPPEIGAVTAIMHGCRPVSAFMEITRIEGPEVFELDGQPALATLEQMIGHSFEGAEAQNITLLATLGQKHGDPFAPFDEKAYVNRLIVGADRAAGSITIFEPDFVQGAKIQVMARDNGLMLDSVRRGVAEIEGLMNGRRPLFSLYLDCAGRASASTGAPAEEAEIAIDASAGLGPMLGFYSGVEIAPVGLEAGGTGVSRPLDWTAVMSALYWRD